MKLWVYIAGPFSKPYPISNMHQAMKVWFTLHCMGYHPVCPHWTGFQDFLTPMPYEEWMDYDRQTLQRCDIILRLPGDSSGADSEVEYFTELGKGAVVYSLGELVTRFPANMGRIFRPLTAGETGKE